VNMKTILKTSVAAAALMAMAAPASAQLANSSRETGRDKVNLKIYGQVNKAVMWGDDGNAGRTFIVDNNVSSTRMGFLATAPVNADLDFGANIEYAFRSNNSGTVAVNNAAAGGGTALDTNTGDVAAAPISERKAEVIVNHKRFGKVSLGQGDEAAEGISEYNLTGAVNVSGVLASYNHLQNTVLFNNTTKAYVATTLGAVHAIIDADRDDRIRYDTPNFMGFVASASFTSGGGSGAALRYDNKLGQFKVVAGVGYINDSSVLSGAASNTTGSTQTDDEYTGSVAVLHDSGLNAHFAAGVRNHRKITVTDVRPDDTTHIGGGVGYIAKIFGVGPTAFAADVYKSVNANRTNTNATTSAAAEWTTTTFGFGVEQTFSDIGTSAYLGYRNFDIGAPTGTEIDDVNVVIAGMRVLF